MGDEVPRQRRQERRAVLCNVTIFASPRNFTNTQLQVHWDDVAKDMGIAASEAMVIFRELMKVLEVHFIEPCLKDATIDQLNTMLIDKKRAVANLTDDLATMKDEMVAVEGELEVKRAMKVVEDSIRAERQLLDEKEGRIKQIVREILMEKKRKRAEVDDAQEGEMKDVKVKKERL